MYSVAPISTPIQPPPVLVETPVPNATGTLRVLPTNVAPSFSNEQVSNESRGPKNSASRLPAAQPQAATQPALAQSPPYSNNPALGAPTNFLAQLISQDISPQATIYLAQYEKLVYFSNVKYKPSNAGKPAPQGLFAKFLQADPQPIILQRVPEPIARISQNNVASRPAFNTEAEYNYEDIAYEPPQANLQSQPYIPDPAILANRTVNAYTKTLVRNENELAVRDIPGDQET